MTEKFTSADEAKAIETINSWSREVTAVRAEKVLNEYSPSWLRAFKDKMPEPYKSAADTLIAALDIPISTPEPPVKKSNRPKGFAALADAIGKQMISKQSVFAALRAGEITEEEKDKLYAMFTPTQAAPASRKKSLPGGLPAQWARQFQIDSLKPLETLKGTPTDDEIWAVIQALGKEAGIGKLNKAWVEKFKKEIVPLFDAPVQDTPAPAPKPTSKPRAKAGSPEPDPALEIPEVPDFMKEPTPEEQAAYDAMALDALVIPDLDSLL